MLYQSCTELHTVGMSRAAGKDESQQSMLIGHGSGQGLCQQGAIVKGLPLALGVSRMPYLSANSWCK